MKKNNTVTIQRNFLRIISSTTCCLAVALLSLVMPNDTMAQMTTINVPGQSNPRSMLVYAPSGIQKNRPLLISLHGLNQDIAYQRGMAKWEQVADTAKFVVVYPQGENNSWDISGQKDLNFILAIIESMVTRYQIDRTRVYLSGFSMGGMLTYHAASNIADKIAAFGPVSCMLFNSIYTNSRPIPIIQTHGDADNVFPYDATLLNYWAGWRTRLKCPTTAVVTKPATGVTVNRWAPCDCNTEYVLVVLAGKGHEHSNTANYNTSVGIWNFVKKYTNVPNCITGIEDNVDKPALYAYPNPFENTLLIKNEGEFNYKIHDMLGKLLVQGQAQDEATLGANLQSGLYLLEMQTKEGIKVLKIQKK